MEEFRPCQPGAGAKEEDPSSSQSAQRCDRRGGDGALKFFLEAPDDVEHPAITTLGDSLEDAVAKPIDVLDQLLEFTHYLPAWLNGDKVPISWQHFVGGLNYIQRLKSRQLLAASDAARMAQVEQDEFRTWRKTHESVARY